MEVVRIHLVHVEDRPITKFPEELQRIHLLHRAIMKFLVEVVRIHLVHVEYRPITKFPVEVVRIHLMHVENRPITNSSKK